MIFAEHGSSNQLGIKKWVNIAKSKRTERGNAVITGDNCGRECIQNEMQF
jgi:hypothetical protein